MARNLENIIGALSVDIAGTLVHIAGEELSHNAEDLIQLDRQGRKVHKKTVALLEKIQNEGMIVSLITGMRITSYRALQDIIPHDYGILEHGGVILQDGKPDEEWTHLQREGIKAVQAYKELIKARTDLPVDDQNRSTSFRIIPDPEEGYTIDSISYILSGLGDSLIMKGRDKTDSTLLPNAPFETPVPKGIKIFVHTPYPPPYGCMEVVPSTSGKGNALQFTLKRHGIAEERTCAFGDDTNDVDMLNAAAYRYTFSGVKQAVLVAVHNAATGNHCYVTPKRGHAGTIDVLEQILTHTIPQLKKAA